MKKLKKRNDIIINSLECYAVICSCGCKCINGSTRADVSEFPTWSLEVAKK